MASFTVEGETLRAAGELETKDLGEFGRAADALIAATEGEIILDFTEVEYMSSSFLGEIMSLRGRLAKDGRGMRLRPSRVVRQLLVLTGMISSIRVED